MIQSQHRTALRIIPLAAIFALALLATPSNASATTIADDVEELTGEAFDRADSFEAEESVDANSEISTYDMEGSRASSRSIKPRQLSDEMLYFCHYESNQNYDQGLSCGDGYHAMGYFQFDNRYGLGDFIRAVYNYDPGKYWALKQIGDWYGWDTSASSTGGDVRAAKSPGGDWTMADDLNWSWHQAYAADPTEFSRLQNDWAYQEYYAPARDWLYSYRGVNLDQYADCAKGMVWGMSNLFGPSGWRKWANGGDVKSSMTSAQLVSSIANYLIASIENGTYNYTYGSSYVRRYRNELSDCLNYLGSKANSLASISVGNIPDGTYTISPASNTGAVLDVSNGSTADGANVQLYSANNTKAQAWKITNVGSGYVTITNVGSGKALDVWSGLLRQGTNVQQYTSTSTDSQKWVPFSNGDGTFRFFSALDQGLVLDICGGSTASGTNVQIYANNGSSAQRFVVRPDASSSVGNDLPDGTYTIMTSLDTPSVLDISAGSKSNGGNAQIYGTNGSDAQKWRVSHDVQGYVTLTNVGSGKVLDVSSALSQNGANVQQYSSNGSAAQKWIATMNGDGTYTFKSKLNPKLVLDISSASRNNSTNVQLWTSNGSAAQRFFIVGPSKQEVMDSLAKRYASSIPNGRFRVSSAMKSSMVLDVSAASTSNGANVQLYSWNGTAAQQWMVSHDEKGYMTLTNVCSGKAADVNSGNASSGTNIWQYALNRSDAQKWIAVPDGNGYRLYSALGSGEVIDISGAGTYNGANVQIYESNGTTAQRFLLSSL